jgi:hypothetical protein
MVSNSCTVTGLVKGSAKIISAANDIFDVCFLGFLQVV